MSGIDNFVFQFISKGEKDLQKALDDIKESTKEAAKEFENLQEAAKLKAGGASELTKLLQKLRFVNSEARKDDYQAFRKMRQEKEDDRRAEERADKEKYRRERQANKDALQEQRRRDKERLNTERKIASERKKENAYYAGAIGIASYFTIGYLNDLLQKAFSRQFDIAMTSEFNSLNQRKIKAFTGAVGEKGGKEETTRQSLSSLQNLLSQLPISKEANEKLWRTLALAGLTQGANNPNAITSADVYSQDAFTVLRAISKAFTGLDGEEKRRTARVKLLELGLDEATINFLAAGKFDEKMSQYGRGTSEASQDLKDVQAGINESIAVIKRLGELTIENFASGIKDFAQATGKFAYYAVKIKDWISGLSLDNIFSFGSTDEATQRLLYSDFDIPKINTSAGMGLANGEVDAISPIQSAIRNYNSGDTSVVLNANSTYNVSSVAEAQALQNNDSKNNDALVEKYTSKGVGQGSSLIKAGG